MIVKVERHCVRYVRAEKNVEILSVETFES